MVCGWGGLGGQLEGTISLQPPPALPFLSGEDPQLEEREVNAGPRQSSPLPLCSAEVQPQPAPYPPSWEEERAPSSPGAGAGLLSLGRESASSARVQQIGGAAKGPQQV